MKKNTRYETELNRSYQELAEHYLDYLIFDGKNKYSVPFDLIGEKIVLRLTWNMVEVFYRGPV